MKTKIILFYLFIFTSVHAQKVSLNSEQRFYIETGINPMLVNFTEFIGGGHSGSFVLWTTQLRLGLPINVMYRNSIFQTGITSTFFTVGTKNLDTQMNSFFSRNDINAHLGFNFFSLFRSKIIFAGPFVEVGYLNMSRNLTDFRPSICAGLEFCVKNSTKISCNFGVFQVSEYEKSVQQLDSYYNRNNFFTFELSHSFPLRLPVPKTLRTEQK